VKATLDWDVFISNNFACQKQMSFMFVVTALQDSELLITGNKWMFSSTACWFVYIKVHMNDLLQIVTQIIIN